MDKNNWTAKSSNELQIVSGIDNSGKNNPFYGRKHSEETKRKMREAWKTRGPASEETRKKMSEGVKKNLPSTAWKIGNPAPKTAFKRGHVAWNEGKHVQTNTGKTHFKKGDSRITGKSNFNWLGGKSFEPYGVEFNNELKEKIRERDQYRCQECFRDQDELYTKSGKKYSLIVHHIDYDKKNNVEENLIALCRSCHLQTNYSRKDWTEYFGGRVNA